MINRILAGSALLAALCAVTAHADDINPVVGKLGSFSIRESDLDRLIGYQSPELAKQFQENPEKKVTLVNQLLIMRGVAEKAKKDGFDRKPEIKEQMGYVIDEFLFREYLYKVVTANVTVPDEELKKYYKEHEKEFLLPVEIKVRHIYFEAPKEMQQTDRDKVKAKAEGTVARLKKGEDFAKLAGEVSDDAETAKTGGELGTITPGKTSSAEFEKVAFALKAGELSDIVETAYGYHIIKVDARKEERTATFDEAKDFISKRLKGEFEQQKAREFVERLTKEAGLEVYAERITGVKSEPKKEEQKK